MLHASAVHIYPNVLLRGMALTYLAKKEKKEEEKRKREEEKRKARGENDTKRVMRELRRARLGR
jgi:hypothetical protein